MNLKLQLKILSFLQFCLWGSSAYGVVGSLPSAPICLLP